MYAFIVSAVEWNSWFMNAIFFFWFGVMYFFSSCFMTASSFSSIVFERQTDARSRSWGLGSFLGVCCSFTCSLVLLAVVLSVSSSEVGSLDVGVWNGIERNRIDSIFAVGTKVRICRCSCFDKGFIKLVFFGEREKNKLAEVGKRIK